MPQPLLSEDDRKEIIRLYTEMKDKYGALDAVIATQVGPMRDRLDALEEKRNQRPSLNEGGQLANELMSSKDLVNRPQMLGRNQSLQVVVSTKAAVSGISRTIPLPTNVVAPGPAPGIETPVGDPHSVDL